LRPSLDSRCRYLSLLLKVFPPACENRPYLIPEVVMMFTDDGTSVTFGSYFDATYPDGIG